MSKYFDLNDTNNIEMVEQIYQKKISDAEESAKISTDNYLDEIKEYRNRSFEEIEAGLRISFSRMFYGSNKYSDLEIIEVCANYLMDEDDIKYIDHDQYNSERKKYIEKAKKMSKKEKEDILNIHTKNNMKNYCLEVLMNKYKTKKDFYDNYDNYSKLCEEELKNLDEEQKSQLLEKYYRNIRTREIANHLDISESKVTKMSIEEQDRVMDEILNGRIEEARKKDVAYDLLTEDQLVELLKFYYQFRLKENLYSMKRDSIHKAANIKSNRSLTRIAAYRLDDPKIIAKIESVEDLNKEDFAKKIILKDVLRDYLSGYGYSLLFSSIVGSGAGILSLICELFSSGTLNFTNIPIGAAFYASLASAVIIPTMGVKGVIDIFRSKTAIQEAKNIGIYDLIVDALKSNEDLVNYAKEIGVYELLDDNTKEFGR